MTTTTAPGQHPGPQLGLHGTIRLRTTVHWQTVAVCALSVLAWGVFAWLSIAQHHAYNTHAYDLSWFDQAAWNTARGHWLSTSFSYGTYLTEHFSPILLVFGAVYRLWSAPEALLLIQAALAAGAAIPLYVAVCSALHSRNAALMIAAAYLVSPHLHGYVLFDFHPDIIAVIFIFTSFAFLQAGRPVASIVALLPVFLVKEDAALIGIGFAVFFWLERHRAHARRLVLGSVVYLVAVELVMAGTPLLLHRSSSGEQGRYSYLLTGRLEDPILVWQHLTGSLQSEAIAYMFGSQAMLPLAGPAVLAAVPDMLVNVLAEHKPQLQLTLQYPLYPLALLLLASVVNIRALLDWKPAGPVWRKLRVPLDSRATFLAALVLLAETVSWLIGSPIGLHFQPARFQTSAHTAALERIVATVPSDASVSAQSSILPHLSERDKIREFPDTDLADDVVVDRKGFVAWDAEVHGYAAVLATLPERGYCLIRADDGVELWRLCGIGSTTLARPAGR